jgi:hypothetical protein
MNERTNVMDRSLLQSPKIVVIMSLMLVLITLGLYNPISRAPFLNYDDDYYIIQIQNSHVRLGLKFDCWVV